MQNFESFESKYCESYVAFIDLLGFSNIIIKATHEKNFSEITSLIKKMNFLKSSIESTYGGEKVKCKLLSDSFIISSARNKSGLVNAFIMSQMLYANLISKGYLVRGGLDLGFYYQDGDAVIGTALINAYRLKSSVAKMPRLIIGQNVKNDISGILVKSHNLHDRVEEDDDGEVILKPFHWISEYIQRLHNMSFLKLSYEEADRYKDAVYIRNMLIEKLNKAENQSQLEKVAWLVRRFNRDCIDSTAGLNIEWLEPISLPSRP